MGLLLCALGIATVCVLQDPSVNKDRESYGVLIRLVAEEGFLVMEPALYALIKLLSLGLSGEHLEAAFFFVVAVVSLYTKLLLFARYGGSLFGCLAAFFSYYFLTQEMTQVRAGLAVGLLYLSWFAYAEARGRAFWWWGIAATMCHYSAAVFIVAPLMFSVRERRKWLFSVAVLLVLNVANLFAGELWAQGLEAAAEVLGFEKLQIYADWLDEGTLTEISPIRLIPHLLLLGMVAWEWKRWRRDRISYLLAQVYVFGILLFGALSPIPVLAYRISDLFLIAGVFVLGRLRRFYAGDLYAAFVLCYTGFYLVYTLHVLGLFGSAQ